MTRMHRLLAGSLLCLGFILVGGACAPGTDGIIFETVGEEADESPLNARLSEIPSPVAIKVPRVPPISLPDLSETASFDALLLDTLGDLATAPVTGIEVARTRCEAKSGQLVFSGNESLGIFEGKLGFNPAPFDFDINEDGSGTYVKQQGVGQGVFSMRSNGDGSGDVLEERNQYTFSVHVRPDRSGEYYLKDGRKVTTVEVNSDGSGAFTRDDPDSKTRVTVAISSDNTGELFSQGENDKTTVRVTAGGGEMFEQKGQKVSTVLVRPDGSWEFMETEGESERRLIVHADGSGEYSQRGDQYDMAYILPFEADGSSEGPMVNIPEAPPFVVSQQFGPLGQVAALAPPCAKVIRFDSQVLFEVNSSTLKAEADESLDNAVRVLLGSGKSIQINGHTDATGSEEYNLELSEARAAAVRDALVERGLDLEIEISGLGESDPIAPNFDSEGNDDEAGQALNRRVEVVINDG